MNYVLMYTYAHLPPRLVPYESRSQAILDYETAVRHLTGGSGVFLYELVGGDESHFMLVDGEEITS